MGFSLCIPNVFPYLPHSELRIDPPQLSLNSYHYVPVVRASLLTYLRYKEIACYTCYMLLLGTFVFCLLLLNKG